jgi:hypothetical protein
MSNPYQSPQPASPVAPPFGGDDREKMRRVARFQQWVLYALLANIVINVTAMATRGSDVVVSLAITALALMIVAAAMFAIFKLANELYSTAVGVVCAVLMIVPCISLITLLIVNGKATTYLQQRGVKVGLMGVNPNKI